MLSEPRCCLKTTIHSHKLESKNDENLELKIINIENILYAKDIYIFIQTK